jgi:hypothetical protein
MKAHDFFLCEAIYEYAADTRGNPDFRRTNLAERPTPTPEQTDGKYHAADVA